MITWRKLPEDDNVRKGFVDWDDYRRFLAELPDELKMLLVFGFHYGIRKSELLTYQWPYVDFFSKGNPRTAAQYQEQRAKDYSVLWRCTALAR
jgi:integrase